MSGAPSVNENSRKNRNRALGREQDELDKAHDTVSFLLVPDLGEKVTLLRTLVVVVAPEADVDQGVLADVLEGFLVPREER